MITTGVIGRPWRASITPWGALQPWDRAASLDWYLAADDRWHVPSTEPSVRQRRLDGTAAVETRIRVPMGDAVQRIYSVADGPGYTVVEVHNDSTLPIAVAFDRRDLRTERPIVDLPIEGIDLPSESFVLPVGHRSTATVALAHDGSGAGPLPAGLPGVDQVVSGWSAVLGRASRLELPPGPVGAALAEEVSAIRSELLLGGPVHVSDDPAAFLIGIGELVRMGENPDPWLPEVALAAERLARQQSWLARVALDAARWVLSVAEEARALADLDRIRRSHHPQDAPAEPPEGAALIPWLEQFIARDGLLLPAGLPASWRGVDLYVRRVPVGMRTTLSFALRWHGARPALLWELEGEEIELRAPLMDPRWRSSGMRGDALWEVAAVPVAIGGSIRSSRSASE